MACESTSQSPGSLSDTYQRRAQVALDVDRQRFYRRNVQNPATPHVVRSRREHDAIDAPQESRQGLASPGWREDEGRFATRNRRPSGNLRSSGRMKDVLNQVRTAGWKISNADVGVASLMSSLLGFVT